MKGSPVLADREGDLAAGSAEPASAVADETRTTIRTRRERRERRLRPQADGADRNPGEPSWVDATHEETVGANSQDGPQAWGTRSGGSVFGKLGLESNVPCWAPHQGKPGRSGQDRKVWVHLFSPTPQGDRADVRRGVQWGTGPHRSRRFVSKL